MRSAADSEDVGCPEPAAVVQRILSTRSWAASSFQAVRWSDMMLPRRQENETGPVLSGWLYGRGASAAPTSEKYPRIQCGDRIEDEAGPAPMATTDALAMMN